MKPIFFHSPTQGIVHILPYTTDTDTTGWFAGTSIYPIMEKYETDTPKHNKQSAIRYAIRNCDISEEFLKLYCLALNQGHILSPNHTPPTEELVTIQTIKTVLQEVSTVS